MDYISKNWILILVTLLSITLNAYLFITIIDKSITQNYQDIGLLNCSEIIKEQEILLEPYWKGMSKEKVIISLKKILKQQENTDLFIAEKHENLMVFSNLNFYFYKNKLEKITPEHFDEKFNVKY